MVDSKYKSYNGEVYYECTEVETGDKFWFMYYRKNGVMTSSKSYTVEDEMKNFIDSIKVRNEGGL